MIPTITAFEQSPDNGLGLARDMPVRWALEEVGQSYDVNLVSFAELKAPDHLALHPFGQIPTYQEDGLTLFESGAIVLHVAQSRAGLLPENAHAQSRAIMWIFSALNTIEPVVWDYDIAPLLEGDKPWHAERMSMLEGRLRTRLASLSDRLGEDDWLDGAFSAGDLMMVSVLRRLQGSRLLEAYPNLAAYVQRGEARPAFKRAFDAQLAVFSARSS